ncbi:MAG: hypothetical protein CML03_01050 [Pseudooceanicola sp.]|nr:hypothetical protein [Pseudooceanicola sp.]
MKKSRLTMAILDAQESSYYSELEREHMGCAETGTGIYHHSLIYPMGERRDPDGAVVRYHFDELIGTEVLDFNLYLSPLEAT